MGNHDAAVVHGTAADHGRRRARGGRLDARPARRAQLAFLGRAADRRIAEDDLPLVHANAFAPAEWAYRQRRAEAMPQPAGDRPAAFTFCGHVHEPRLYPPDEPPARPASSCPCPASPIPLSPQRRWLAIPGSAGQPRDGNPAALLRDVRHRQRTTLTFHRVPYDHEAAAAKIRAAGLPRAPGGPPRPMATEAAAESAPPLARGRARSSTAFASRRARTRAAWRRLLERQPRDRRATTRCR